MGRRIAIILEKDNIYYSFESESCACDFLGVKHGTVSRILYEKRQTLNGYHVIRAISEQDIYANKRLHKIWEAMHERCYRKTHVHYARYGGRGIKVCDEWKHNYINFAKWAYKNGYKDGLTIDRKDNDGNYEPSNCRWSTYKEQNNNTSNNRIIEYNGAKYTASQLADLTGLNVSTIFGRINQGWTIEDVISKPLRERKTGWRKSKRYQ